MRNKAGFRTAPATPGLVNNVNKKKHFFQQQKKSDLKTIFS